jgi:hypothetical protein
MIANVSTEWLNGRGVSFYLTDLLGKPYTHYTIILFRHRKTTKLHGIRCH